MERNHTVRDLLPAAAALVMFSSAANLNAAARGWQDTIQLPTYQEGEADPNPQFAAFSADPVNYPYPLRKQFTGKRADRTWRTLNLENEYLFCRILPDLGGHLYNCRDKRNRQEVFYANPVVKPGPVGQRGSWVAMGIEANFPIAHSRVTTSPVDFAVRSAPDGSASATVEDIDRTTGMQWRVEYRLRPASTVLEMNVVLYNRTPARQPYYWWANASVPFDDPATRFILPAYLAGSHGRTEIVTWPVASAGIDESLAAGHKYGAGWFAYACEEPFFAVWRPATRSGVAHFADASEVPGKKLWRWGTDGDAYVRRDLTDNFSSYVEIQCGLMENQETFDFLGPEQVKSFQEAWIPIHDLGGVSRATKDAILSLQRRPALEVEIGATHPIQGATIRVVNRDRVVFEEHADLDPAKVYRHVLENPNAAPYTVRLVDANGAILLDQTEGVYRAVAAKAVQLGRQPQTDWRGEESEEGLLARGRFNELHSLWKFAESDYSIAVRRFPKSVAAKRAKARLAMELHRFEEAAELWGQAQAASGDDETAYQLGVSRVMLGHDGEARKLLTQVVPASPFGAAAALQLTFLSARARDFAGALASLKPLLEDRTGTVRAGAIESALLRHLDRKPDASKRLAAWRNIDPADIMLRFEATLLGAADDALWTHLGADSERVLNLVDEYMNLGLYDDALALLNHSYAALPAEQLEPGAVAPVQSPLIAFYRAFCRKTSGGGDAAADLRAAGELPVRYVFPNRASSFRVLRAAVAADSSNASAHFLLGRLYLSSLMTAEAITEWRSAQNAKGRFPELAPDLERAQAELKKDDAQIARVTPVATAEKVAPKQAPTHAPAPAAPAPQGKPAPPGEVASNALLLSSSGKANEAVGLFTERTFPSDRQPDEVRRAYIESRLQQLITGLGPQSCPAALDAMDRLGDEDKGLPFTFRGFGKQMSEPHFQFYMGLIEQACQADKGARRRFSKVSKMNAPPDSPESVYPLIAAMRLNPAEARPRVEQALEAARNALAKANAESKPGLKYREAVLLGALGQNQPAAEGLQEVVQTAKSVWLQYLAGCELRRIKSSSQEAH
jgi:tetratricopeptide (TPR) repeat protein